MIACLIFLVAGILFGVAAWWLLVQWRLGPFNDERFDANRWKTDKENRGPMLVDLYQKLKMGAPRKDVIAMLGFPGSTKTNLSDYENEKGDTPSRIDLYYLGMWSGWRIDGDYLYVLYDASDRIGGVFAAQH